jgi:cysteine desulfurase
MVTHFPDTHRVYLDEASDAPPIEEAEEAYSRWFQTTGDPARPYVEGITARRAVEAARQDIARFVGATPRNVTFCSSATEALNWLVYAAAMTGAALVVSKVEHSAVTVTSRKLASELGLVLVEAEVDETGRVRPTAFEEAVSEAEAMARREKSSKVPIYCFVQHANHELGTIQPLAELAEIARRYGAKVIADAAQTVGRIPVDLHELGVSALVISAHKFGGPKGAGAVVTTPGFRPRPLLYGASQERGRRAGTENVAAIAAFGAACRRVSEDVASEARRQYELTDNFIQRLSGALHGVRVLGDRNERVPHIVSLELEGVQGEAVVLSLDKRGFAVHSGSACAAEAFEPSPILEAVGADSRRNLRISIGRTTTAAILERFLTVLREEIERLKVLATDPGQDR